MSGGGSAAVTLCDGDFWPGVAALANSLHAHGFRGRLWIGHRGALPGWAAEAVPSPDGFCREWDPAPGLALRFVPISTSYHLTHYKGTFLLDVAAHDPSAARFFFIDADITVARDWAWFEAWADRAVAVCEDVNNLLPDADPRREGWRRFFGPEPFGHRFGGRAFDRYCNGGFFGVTRERLGFVRLWRELVEGMAEAVGGLHRWSSEKPGPFFIADQDALNIALMLTPELVEAAGSDAMGFRPGEIVLPHSIGPRKPWRRPWFWPSLLGRFVAASDEAHWRFASGPAGNVSRAEALLRGADLRIGRTVAGWRRKTIGR